MNNHYQIIWDEDIREEEWTQLMGDTSQSQPSFFQSPKCYQILKQFNDWRVHAIGLKFNGALVAILVFVVQKEKGLKGFFSERCIVFSGPIFNDVKCLNYLLSALEKKVSGSIYIEIRNGYLNNSFKSIYHELNWEYKKWLNFIVDTTDVSALLKNMSESRRRQLRKAERNGVVFKNPSCIEDVEIFYSILHALYKSKIKKPLPSWDLFRLFFESDPRNFVLVYAEQKIIGGILCPFLPGYGLYEFYVAGLDDEHRDFYPSAMATYGAMVQAFELGIPKFDFMGGGNPEEGYGVREFKARFGGEQVEWGRWLKVRKPFLFWLGKKYVQLRSK